MFKPKNAYICLDLCTNGTARYFLDFQRVC